MAKARRSLLGASSLQCARRHDHPERYLGRRRRGGLAQTFHRATVSRSIRPTPIGAGRRHRGGPNPQGQIAWEARVVMTASPTDDHSSAERRIQELTEELSLARGELAEAREQQTATGGILRAISNSSSDLQVIFQEIATTAAHLCDAHDAGVLQCAGDHLRLVAHRGHIPYLTHPAGEPVWVGQGILPLSRGVVIGRAVLDRTIIQVPDLQAETEEYPVGSEFARRLGHRTILAMPLIRDRDAIGAIFVRRTEVRPFTDRQIDLLRTFADQAVIAIENTRLFEEVQARNRALAEANAKLTETLEQQTATSEIL